MTHHTVRSAGDVVTTAVEFLAWMGFAAAAVVVDAAESTPLRLRRLKRRVVRRLR